MVVFVYFFVKVLSKYPIWDGVSVKYTLSIHFIRQNNWGSNHYLEF